jgi:hypothetical protein
MIFLNLIIVPLLIAILSVYLQSHLEKDEFINFFKVLFIGLVAGVILNIVTGFFTPLFEGKANFIVIGLKSLFIDGVLFSAIIVITFYFVLDFFVDMGIRIDWAMTTIFSVGYLGGIYTVLNIVETCNKNFPANPLMYLSFFSVLIIVSIVIGYGIPRYLDSYDTKDKSTWVLFTIGIPALCFMFYSFFKFYDMIFQYIFVIILIPVVIIFEKNEFELFRK